MSMLNFLAEWSPVLTIEEVLLSLQSLSGQQPYYDDSHRGHLRIGIDHIEESQEYNRKVRYETIRVAILGMMENSQDSTYMPVKLKDKMMAHFYHNIHDYARMIRITVEANKLKWPSIYEELQTKFLRLKADFESDRVNTAWHPSDCQYHYHHIFKQQVHPTRHTNCNNHNIPWRP